MTSPTVITLLTEEQLRAIVVAAVREVLNSTSVDGDCYNTAEAADYLRTTVPALRTMVQRGQIRPDSPGKRGRFRGHRFSRATLDAFISEGR